MPRIRKTTTVMTPSNRADKPRKTKTTRRNLSKKKPAAPLILLQPRPTKSSNPTDVVMEVTLTEIDSVSKDLQTNETSIVLADDKTIVPICDDVIFTKPDPDNTNTSLSPTVDSSPSASTTPSGGKKRKRKSRKPLRVPLSKDSLHCVSCDYQATCLSKLDRHNRTHTGEKNFACSVCEAVFSQKANLITHSLIHTSEKPYKCEECNYSCRQLGNLRAHMRKHEKEDDESVKDKCLLCPYSMWIQ